MISLDEVNEEWKKQDARLDAFRAKAKLMHESLIREVEGLNYDIYQREGSIPQDTLPAISQQLVNKDANLRKIIKGPTIVKEKFHPPYWKRFNQERDLLEEISRREFLRRNQQQASSHTSLSRKDEPISSSKEMIQHIPFSPNKDTGKISQQDTEITKRKTISSPNSAKARRKSKNYELLKGDYINRNWKSAVFASPTNLQNDPDRSKFFDGHLLGRSNSLEQLAKWKDISNRNMVYERKGNATKTLESSGYDPNVIGHASVKGGDLAQGPQRAKQPDCITKACEIPNLADTGKTVLGGAFSLERRFPLGLSPSASGGVGLSSSQIFSALVQGPTISFQTSKRFPTQEEEKSKNLLATPGPGNYTLNRLFEVDPKAKRKDFDAIYEKYKDESRGLSGLTTHELSLLAVIGHHCNLQEHILYGRCNHPLCCRRTEDDKMVLRSNDLQRVAGIEKAESLDYTKTLPSRQLRTKSSQRVLLSRTITPLLPQPQFKMLALYTAAFKNDIPTIQHLSTLHVDPNDFNEENGYTALHIAVAQNNEEAVIELLQSFSETIDLNLQERSYGNTALHIACQKLFKSIVMILCQENRCDPEKHCNYKGEYAKDVCYIQNIKHNNSYISHEIWQIIDITIERNLLQKDLDSLTMKEKKKKIWER